jgi:iron complex outermembrane receptor protein
MTRSYRAARLGVSAAALLLTSSSQFASAQQSSPTTTLPTITVRPCGTTARPAKASQPVQNPDDEAVPAAGPPTALPSSVIATPIPRTDATGLSVPLTSTVVTGTTVDEDRVASNDATSILRRVPGFAVYQGGGVSSLPVINGLADDRVLVVYGGMSVAAACANHMNPPLSYADPSQVGSVEVVNGVAPVSKGGDSIAGTIIVEAPTPRYAIAGEGLRTSGSISSFYRSNGQGFGASANAEVATSNVSLRYDGAWSRSDDYDRGGDGAKVRSTEYEAGNQSLTLNGRRGVDSFTLQAGLQTIPYQAYVNQRMDMVDNHAVFLNAKYATRFEWGSLEARLYFQRTSHEMNFLADKLPAEMPMRTEQKDFGYSVKAEIPVSTAAIIRVGNELRAQRLDDWWPAIPGSMMMGPDDYLNVKDGRRTRLGTYAEWENKWTRSWSTLLGARNDVVWMDTGNVQSYCSMGMMCADDFNAANAFNALDHKRTDVNFDLTALARYEPAETVTLETGYARKTRSPNLYERYAWGMGNMSSSMIGWFGDANGYVGNLDLKPEIAHTASFTAGFHDRSRNLWELKATPYFTYVDDFIDVDRIGSFTDMKGDTFTKLKFANHDARLYGINVSAKTQPYSGPQLGKLAVSGVVGYVHGERVDGGALYHIMPLNARLELAHRLGGWSNAIELVLVDDKDRVDKNRNEFRTAGYALVNLRTAYEWDSLRLDLGVENLFDRLYYSPLGGADFADYNAVGGRIGPVPGNGPLYQCRPDGEILTSLERFHRAGNPMPAHTPLIHSSRTSHPCFGSFMACAT